jgi:hypothetical protein
MPWTTSGAGRFELGVGELEVREEPARAEAGDEAAVRHHVDAGEDLGQHARGADGRGHHHDAELGVGRVHGERGQRRQRVVARVVAGGGAIAVDSPHDVVGQPERIEARGLGPAGGVDHRRPVEGVVAGHGEVVLRQGEAELHGVRA